MRHEDPASDKTYLGIPSLTFWVSPAWPNTSGKWTEPLLVISFRSLNRLQSKVEAEVITKFRKCCRTPAALGMTMGAGVRLCLPRSYRQFLAKTAWLSSFTRFNPSFRTCLLWTTSIHWIESHIRHS